MQAAVVVVSMISKQLPTLRAMSGRSSPKTVGSLMSSKPVDFAMMAGASPSTSVTTLAACLKPILIEHLHHFPVSVAQGQGTATTRSSC
jgi:hypothetical protein